MNRIALSTVGLAIATSAVLAVAQRSAASPSASSTTASVWLATETGAESQLPQRFKNIRAVKCDPDRTGASKLIKSVRWWNRFKCAGTTYDRVSFSLTFKATGECANCWTIINLTGTGANHLRTRAAVAAEPKPQPAGAVLAKQHAVWITTARDAQGDIPARFANVRTVSCPPDPSSATSVIGNARKWNRFLCTGKTYAGVQFTITYKVTGQCSTCWTVFRLAGESVDRLRSQPKASPRAPARPPCSPAAAPAAASSRLRMDRSGELMRRIATSLRSGCRPPRSP